MMSLDPFVFRQSISAGVPYLSRCHSRIASPTSWRMCSLCGVRTTRAPGGDCATPPARNGMIKSVAKITELVYLGHATECVVELPGAASLIPLSVNQKLELEKGQDVRIGF